MKTATFFLIQILLLVGAVSRFSTAKHGISIAHGRTVFLFEKINATIDVPRPRLWWDEARLRHARAWYAKTRPKPIRDDVRDLAFRFLMGAEPRGCEEAIKWLMNFTISPDELSHVASDNARWHGEDAMLAYDWCHDQMTPAQRDVVLNRWNGYLTELMSKVWGGLGMPQSNYFWGDLRNEIEWAITTNGENPQAKKFATDALRARWHDSFVPHSLRSGRGGVPQEGSQYGAYLLSYSLVPFFTSGLQNRDLYNETDFFKGSVFYLIYATTPSATTLRGTTSQQYEIFPFNDDERFKNGGSATSTYYADFMSVAANQWANVPLGQYARAWLKITGSTPSSYVQAVDAGGPPRQFASLPLDYYAPGPRYFYGRTSWAADATTINLQLGDLSGVGHAHLDYGSWQIWRKGRWLSRETAGYSDKIAGFGGVGVADTTETIAHNSLLFNGLGIGPGERDGSPIVKRLESRPEYSYAVVDLSSAYRSKICCASYPERDNPAVSHLEREFLFVRGLETMVIFDRLSANATSTISAKDVVKTFVAHFEQAPIVEDDNDVTSVNGTQAIRLSTLVPARPRYKVVAEGGEVGQFRLEVNDHGSDQSHFLSVLQCKEKSGANLISSLEQDQQSYVLTLRAPDREPVTIVFKKGKTSSGGDITFGQRRFPLSPRIQEITVTDNGPVWE
jgi:hypothetical protein